jgi:hypothetical protein
VENPEPEPRWYEEGEWVLGLKPKYSDRLAGGIYGVLVVGLLASAGALGLDLSKAERIILGIPIALAHPAWSWFETRALEKWIRTKTKAQRDAERAYFKLMTEHARLFWAALLTVYGALLIKGA